MEGVKLAEQEQTYYGELFQNCDIDGSGKVTGSKASDLFRLSGLSQDVLLQVSAKNNGNTSMNCLISLSAVVVWEHFFYLNHLSRMCVCVQADDEVFSVFFFFFWVWFLISWKLEGWVNVISNCYHPLKSFLYAKYFCYQPLIVFRQIRTSMQVFKLAPIYFPTSIVKQKKKLKKKIWLYF